jgi:hypothetical protein
LVDTKVDTTDSNQLCQCIHTSATLVLKCRFDANRKTISRWLTYFRELFPQSKTWKKARGFVSSTVANQDLPGSLVAFYLKHISSVEKAIISCLGLLTTGSLPVKMMVK